MGMMGHMWGGCESDTEDDEIAMISKTTVQGEGVLGSGGVSQFIAFRKFVSKWKWPCGLWLLLLLFVIIKSKLARQRQRGITL